MGGPTLRKRRRITLNPEGDCLCSPALRFGQLMQFLRWKAVVAGFHWLVRFLMKDLACSRVVARSRSTRRVLVKDSPFQRPRIRTSPAARSKTTFTTGLFFWAGQFVSQACTASAPVKKSTAAFPKIWRNSDASFVSEPRVAPAVSNIATWIMGGAHLLTKGRRNKATTAVAPARPSTHRHFHNVPDASSSGSLAGTGGRLSVSRTLVCSRPRAYRSYGTSGLCPPPKIPFPAAASSPTMPREFKWHYILPIQPRPM